MEFYVERGGISGFEFEPGFASCVFDAQKNSLLHKEVSIFFVGSAKGNRTPVARMRT